MLKRMQSIKWTQVLIWLFPVLFLIDNILGFNGYQFTVAGKSIRIILFCITVAELCVYSLYVIIKEKIALLPSKNANTTIWSMLRPLDYVVLFFIFGNAVWATVVPLFVRGEMIFSLKDYSTILVLVLYFPLAFLIRTGRLELKILEKMIYVLSIILALWHCVMYIGDTIHPGFYESYYDFIDIISFGTAVRTSVIYGYGIVRVIQTTSMFLLPGIFMALRYLVNGKWWHTISLAIFIFAICVTYTKSIWFGFVAGLVLYLGGCMIFKKDNVFRLRCAISAAIAVVMIIVFNFTVFSNTIYERAFNTVDTNQSIELLQQELDKLENDEGRTELENKLKDALGTQQANNMRSQQNRALIKKWSQNKWTGVGFGGYTDDCVRSEQFPYMYESTFPALLMKVGLLGCFVWIVFIGGATIAAARTFWKGKRENLFFWLGIALSFAMAVQTNPFLFTFAGFSVLCYLLISVQQNGTDRG